MTKTARVICIFFIISFFFVFSLPVSAGFAELLKPIPDPEESLPLSGGLQPRTPEERFYGAGDQIAETAPPITFGDLLNNNSSVSAVANPEIATDEAEIAAKTAQFKKLLAKLEESYQMTLEEFNAKREEKLAFLAATTNQTITLLPTPTVFEQNLLADIASTAITPVPSPIANNQSQTTNSPPLTNNTLGALDQNPPKNSYTIALLGDSMTDTLGKNLPHLRNMLQNAYPTKFFSLLNYGQGATDMEKGLERLTNSTNYLGTDYPPLLSYKPDILVVESFAYNHWSGEKYDLDRQWLTIAKIIDTVRVNSPDTKIILAATIAPNKYIFGDGVLNWSSSMKENSSLIIKAYLQNMVNFATSQRYPLADAYHPALQSDGQGIAGYINSSDHLHPSGDGAYLYSRKIVEAIKNNALIN